MIVAQNSYQAIRGSDVECQCWLRDDAGRVDASGFDMQVEAVGYGRCHVRAQWPAVGDAQGNVKFAVPSGHKLNGGLYQLRLRSEQFGPVVSLGLLEIV